MASELFLVWYFLIGLLLSNGVPHFVFGAAGKTFRSPFGRKSKPKVNILWGLSNFALATIIGICLSALKLYDGYSLIALLVGFWLVVLMFGLQIKDFIGETK